MELQDLMSMGRVGTSTEETSNGTRLSFSSRGRCRRGCPGDTSSSPDGRSLFLLVLVFSFSRRVGVYSRPEGRVRRIRRSLQREEGLEEGVLGEEL